MTEIKNQSRPYNIISSASFICTVYNEEKSMPHFLRSFFEQSSLPSEMIFVDGGSKDKTIEVIKDFFSLHIHENFKIKSLALSDNLKPGLFEEEQASAFFLAFESLDHQPKNGINIKIFKKENAGISEGRNIAISNASGEIICVSDAGCVLDKNWISEITKFYLNSGSVFVCGGASQPIALSYLEKLLSICIMPSNKEIKPEKFMPSSRNLSFKKSVWQEVGGYPENLDFGEDMKLNFNIKKAGYEIIYNPQAIVYWRMRENMALIFKQFFRYAKGDAKGKMYLHRHLIRILSFLMFIAILTAASLISPWIFIIYIPIFILYIFKPSLRISTAFKHIKNNGKRAMLKVSSLMLLPFMLLYIDTAKISGFFYGLVKSK